WRHAPTPRAKPRRHEGNGQESSPTVSRTKATAGGTKRSKEEQSSRLKPDKEASAIKDSECPEVRVRDGEGRIGVRYTERERERECRCRLYVIGFVLYVLYV